MDAVGVPLAAAPAGEVAFPFAFRDCVLLERRETRRTRERVVGETCVGMHICIDVWIEPY